MDKLAPGCQPLKVEYDACLGTWYKKQVLSGNLDGAERCAPLFDIWRECVEEAVEEMNERRRGGP
eukprot:CAMPEP_0118855690 /NCGR_PEP_ID=MMETSP1163-20130328/3428_1 /TAXON_ID=124430 /ORGANISM="Phaeomonas parva, Strain CCMP2877" /LENGTH=64 /DNA_ID=CAMNT_0006788625 /DNA_START=189 /DNA_END=383 /DNA_ORIENTATION=+